MIAILLVGLLATANAAPLWHHFSTSSPDDASWDDELGEDLKQNVEMVESTVARYGRESCLEEITGDEYEITIPLRGFQEKDILVKAKKGVLVIQAITSEGNFHKYTQAKGLPECVRAEGNWSLEKGKLKIVLPVKRNSDSEGKAAEEAVTLENVTPAPGRSLEETANVE